MFWRISFGVSCLVLMFNTAFADYPYTGYFDYSGEKQHPKNAPLMCALHFFLQHDDGVAEDYILDVETFRTKKKIVFMRAIVTTCTYVPSRKTEFCTSSLKSSSGTETSTFSSYIIDTGKDNIAWFVFMNEKEYNAFVLSSDERLDIDKYPTAFQSFASRCPFHSKSTLAPYLKSDNSLSRDETTKLTFVSPETFEELRVVAEEVSKILSPSY